MKRLSLVLLVAVFALMFAACGTGTVGLVDDTRPVIYAEGDLPVVNINSPDAAQINREVNRWAGPPRAGSTAFFYAQHDDVLSLILCMAGGDALSYSYLVWNIDVRTGELVDNLTLLELAGWDYDELSENLLARLANFYEAQRDGNGRLPAASQRNYDKMRSELAHSRVPRLFWAQSGRLWWVGQLSFGDGLQISDDHHTFGAGGFVDILIDPAAPENAYVFDLSILEHTGWDVLEQ